MVLFLFSPKRQENYFQNAQPMMENWVVVVGVTGGGDGDNSSALRVATAAIHLGMRCYGDDSNCIDMQW